MDKKNGWEMSEIYICELCKKKCKKSDKNIYLCDYCDRNLCTKCWPMNNEFACNECLKKKKID
jgi:hypothetical protein